MKRKLAVLTAAIIGLSTTAFTTVLPQEFNAFTEIDASALTIIAEIKELSLEKDTIEIGETTHLNAKFDSGITDNAECGSSNSSVVKVVSGSVKDGWEIEGIGEGTAKILVHNGIYEKSVEITVTSGGTVEMVPYHITNGDTVEFYGSENDEFLVCCKEAKTFDFTMDEDTHNFTPKEDGMYIITRMEHVYDVVNVSEYHVHCDYPNYYNYMVNVENSEISVKVEGMYSGYNNYALEAYLDCDDEKPEVCNKIGCQGEYSFSDAVSALVSYWNGRMNSQIYYPSIERNGAVLPCIAFKRVDENSITNEDRKLDFAFIECSSGTNGNFEFTTPDLLSVAITMGSWDLFESQTGTTYFSISKNNETVNYAVDIDEDDRIIQSSLRIVDDAIKGDVNADGNFTVADVVMLQKWLLAVPDVTLPNWKAADLCEDGKLDVFDLCMMKRELISNTDNKPVLTKTELRDIILSKEEYTWSDFEQYQSEDIGSGLYVLKYKVDYDGEDIEVYLYITGSDLKKKPEKIYMEVKRDEDEENINIYEFRQQLIDFIDSFNRQDMTMDDVLELSKKGKNLTWSDFENYQHGEDIGSGLAIYEFNIANYSDRFTLVVGYSDENSIQYARLKNLGYSIDITESSEDEIWSFIAMCTPPA